MTLITATSGRLGLHVGMPIRTFKPSEWPPDLRCAHIAVEQYGLIGREQALHCGLSRSDISHRVAARFLEPILPCVYRLPGAPSSWHQRAAAACLWIGPRGAVTDLAAAKVHRLECIRSGLITVTTTSHLTRPAPWVVVRQVKRLDPCDLTTCGAITVATVARTLMDLGTRIAEPVIEEAIDEAIRRGLTSIPELRSTLARLGKRGRNGTAALRRLLEIRDPTHPVPESVLERRLLRVLKDAGLPEPVAQFEVRDEDGSFVARVDFAYPGLKIAIEADSRTHHFGHTDWQKDLDRRSRLAAAGWLVIHITWLKVRTRPQEVAAQVRKALATASHRRNVRAPAP